MVTILWTGLDRFRQVWTSQNRCEGLFLVTRESHAFQIWPSPQTCVQFSNRTSLETLQPSEVVATSLHHASLGIRCELVWKTTSLRHTAKTDTSLESSRLAEFECEISPGYDVRQKKLWLSIISAWRLPDEPGLEPPPKGVNYHFSLLQLDEPYVVGKLSILEA